MDKGYSKLLVVILITLCIGVWAQNPNILFIIGDDMGADMLNGFDIGTNLPNTPHLDSLRTSGVAFTNVWAAPVCSPTRAAVFSGLHGIKNGVMNSGARFEVDLTSLFEELDAKTDSVYAKALVGKWHLGRNDALVHGADDFSHCVRRGSASRAIGRTRNPHAPWKGVKCLEKKFTSNS